MAAIRAAIGRSERITVHGDYDVDGMCSTAILVGALRRAGAECDWLIPDRLGDGYGLSAGLGRGARASAARGLLITADCGIASVAEVDALLAAGVEVVVTDHHQPGEDLPACPIVHPVVSGYPFEGLCGAAVAHKLVRRARAGARRRRRRPERDLDLVALATVADLVPLVDENRTLARRGIAELRRARRPGHAGADGGRERRARAGRRGRHRLPAGAAPERRRAALPGRRRRRADAGDRRPARAATIAAELDAANHERRETERGVSNEAEAALRALPDEPREAPAIVVAGEGWHPGVVGIVASRIVERHGRPAIVLSIDEGGRAKGSGRSVPGFDLLAALDACSDHLDRYGGHRAAAGMELAADADRAHSARAFAAHAREVDARGRAAEPGAGSTPSSVPKALDLRRRRAARARSPRSARATRASGCSSRRARVGDVRPMGEEGRHARFTPRQRRRHAARARRRLQRERRARRPRSGRRTT